MLFEKKMRKGETKALAVATRPTILRHFKTPDRAPGLSIVADDPQSAQIRFTILDSELGELVGRIVGYYGSTHQDFEGTSNIASPVLSKAMIVERIRAFADKIEREGG